MKSPHRAFYETWAEEELRNPERKNVLLWKAVNLANLVFRTLRNEPIRSVCEIGGAEGTVLNGIGSLINAPELVNYELSSIFCEAGIQIHPSIQFVNSEFESVGKVYDLIILSDIIEHVEDEDIFLNIVCNRCRFVVCKIPIEKSFTGSDIFYKIRGRSKPANLRYGLQHINGHLRGYNLKQARASVTKYFNILDDQISDVVYFYGNQRRLWVKRWLGIKMAIWLFGGAYFALGQSRQLDIKSS